MVLGAVQIADAAKQSTSAAVRDAVIIGAALLACVVLLIVVVVAQLTKRVWLHRLAPKVGAHAGFP
jgi:hypothetical protein